MNIGILGFAHGHVHCYVSRWRERQELGISVVCGWDHDRTRLADAAAKHEIRTCQSAADVVQDRSVDAVVIASETALHADLVELAAAARKPIVLQKPLAVSMAQADRIVEAVESTGVPFTIAWQMRTDPQNTAMREMARNGSLGRIFLVRRRHCLPTHQWPWIRESWHVNPRLNRDIWADDAAHAVDFIYWLLGMPVSVTAEIASLLDPAIPMDNGIAIFRFPDGAIAEVVCSFVCEAGENTTEITAEKGMIVQNYGDGPSCSMPRAPNATGLKWHINGSQGWTESPIPSPNNHGERIFGLAGPLAEFLHGKRPPIATAREGRDVLRMILACYESSEKGIRVML